MRREPPTMLLSVLLCAAQAATWQPVDVVAPAGRFSAEIRKAAGQERVDDALARWRLSVFEQPREPGVAPLWSCLIQHRAGERVHLLADDGRTFVALEPEFTPSRGLVRAWRDSEPLADLTAGALGIERPESARGGPAPWLASAADAPALEWIETPRGPTQFLRLTTLDGTRRWIALDDGEVRDAREVELPLYVEPPASRAEKPGLRVPATDGLIAPRDLFWGEPLEVRVSGSYPTPNWLFVGFEIQLGAPDEAGARELLLAPIAAPPPKDSIQAQVIVDFDATARVFGLMPGSYRLRLDGLQPPQEPQRIDVGFAKPAIELHRRGGFAGMEQSLRLYPSGVVVEHWARPVRDPATRFGVVRRERMERLRELVMMLDAPPRAVKSEVVDAVSCELVIHDRRPPRVFRYEEPGASGPLLDLAGELGRLFD